MNLNNTAHFVMQSKGGAGKSVCSAILAQYLTEKTDGNIKLIDTDPSNKTLGSYQSLDVNQINVIGKNKLVDQSSFDTFNNDFIEGDHAMLVDTGSGDFLAINNYISNNEIPSLFEDMGKKLFIHCPINYGQSKVETLRCLSGLVSLYPETGIIVWENEFFGTDDKRFTETDAFKKNKNILGVVTLAKKNADTDERDFSRMLHRSMTFEDVRMIEDKEVFGFIQKVRIDRIKKDIWSQLDQIFVE